MLAGLTVALSMVPEALSFSVMIGMSPVVGMQTAAVMAICAALFGSQASSVTGAAGATAVVLVPLTAAYGPAYIPATVLLAGVFQVYP
jgi:SulP family sulfate permease